MMSEKKKFMPAITNYSSDNDDGTNSSLDSLENPPDAKNNYAEWRLLENKPTNIQNGARPTQTLLGDISSCEDESTFGDTEHLFKITNNLAEKDAFRRRNKTLRRKKKKPSHFLLFCRLKHQKHTECSFNDLCNITHASWDNMQAAENEELIGNIDARLRDYNEVLLRFRAELLPESIDSSRKSSAASQQVPTVSPLTNGNAVFPKSHSKIPERLQGLAGDASVYHAPGKSTRPNHHRLQPLVFSANSVSKNHKCSFPGCDNKPVDDHRWDGQYCSAACLIKHCRETFDSWMTQQKEMPAIGDKSDTTDDEIMLLLASPDHSDEVETAERADNLFESLRRTNGISCDNVLSPTRIITKPIRPPPRPIIIDLDDEPEEVTPPVIEPPTRMDAFELFRDIEERTSL